MIPRCPKDRSPALLTSRRRFLAGAAAVLAAVGLRGRAGAQEPGPVGVDGLVAVPSEIEVIPNEARVLTATFGGQPVGPLLRARRGEPALIALENRVDFPFGLRVQGLRGAPAVSAGSREPAVPLAPGGRMEVALTPPDAGLFVYAAEITPLATATRGAFLTGVLVVDGESEDTAHRELILALNALELRAADAAADAAPLRVSTVNGMREMTVPVRPGERLRLRIASLAVSAMTVVRLPGAPLVIAVDSQPCEPFPPLGGRVTLPPGGRADVIIDIPRARGEAGAVLDELDGGRPLVRFLAEGAELPRRPFQERLIANPLLPAALPLQRATRLTMTLSGASPVPATLGKVKSGSTVQVTFENKGFALYGLRLQGHAARLLDGMDDGWKPWWHDCLFLRPGETQRIAFVAGPPGRYGIEAMPIGVSSEVKPVATALDIT